MNSMKKSLVGIIMGSSSDSRIMHGAAEILDEFGVPHEDQIISAHRTPTRLEEYAKHAEKSGFKVIIAGAGGAAHLPGMIASHTVLPVIGVPIMVYNDKQQKKSAQHKFSAFGGLDSLLSISEMPIWVSCSDCWCEQGGKCWDLCPQNSCQRVQQDKKNAQISQAKAAQIGPQGISGA